ncbi:photosynthetic reaction center cytochrome PufC [Nevskia ramosa]|uniref:photosynthetic reaction center cytochrome PufC n=1 Tax=Nevskia ramosa TaxID=64002 RepID=UPI0023578E75|nr:photosynthetic reaction center cytochrome PufC [Nevskia ramosa]
MSQTGYRMKTLLALASAALLLAGCERPPVEDVQHGYRGTGMVQVYNPRIVAEQATHNAVPAAQPAAAEGGPIAGTIYQNVKVLGGLSIGEFNRTMLAMTSWVAPKEGCAYCHNPANLAEDSKYQKVVARRMLEMTQHINSTWKPHVQETGVTCYTCHRGQPVPANIWYTEADNTAQGGMGNRAGQNRSSAAINGASLPGDPFTPFLLNAEPIRIEGTTALAPGNRKSIKQGEWTFALMTHMSQSLGVNCTYCHNSRNFAEWTQAPPQRAVAWHGIRMARELNKDYLQSLTDVFPKERKGPLGDVAKLNCATCHQGAYKPLYGAPMLKDYVTALGAPIAAPVVAPPAAAPAEGEAPPAETSSTQAPAVATDKTAKPSG